MHFCCSQASATSCPQAAAARSPSAARGRRHGHAANAPCTGTQREALGRGDCSSQPRAPASGRWHSQPGSPGPGHRGTSRAASGKPRCRRPAGPPGLGAEGTGTAAGPGPGGPHGFWRLWGCARPDSAPASPSAIVVPVGGEAAPSPWELCATWAFKAWFSSAGLSAALQSHPPGRLRLTPPGTKAGTRRG